MPHAPKQQREKKRGFALFTAIWIVALATVITMAISSLVRSYVQLSASATTSVHLEAAAEAGLTLAINELLNPNENQPWPRDGSAHDVEFDDFALTIQIRDAAGLVDLNTASRDLLAVLFESAGADTTLARRLADQAVDWRDPDRTPTGSGGEADIYNTYDRQRGPKNAPFVALEEIVQLPDFAPRMFDQIQRLATLHSGLVGVDPTAAPQPLLDVIGIEPGFNALAMSSTGPARRLLAASNHTAFVIEIAAADARGSTILRRVTVRLNRSSLPPFKILDWSSPRARVVDHEASP